MAMVPLHSRHTPISCNITATMPLHPSAYITYTSTNDICLAYASTDDICLAYASTDDICLAVDLHFSHVPPFDRRDSLFICEKLIFGKKVEAATYFIFILKEK